MGDCLVAGRTVRPPNTEAATVKPGRVLGASVDRAELDGHAKGPGHVFGRHRRARDRAPGTARVSVRQTA